MEAKKLVWVMIEGTPTRTRLAWVHRASRPYSDRPSCQGNCSGMTKASVWKVVFENVAQKLRTLNGMRHWILTFAHGD